MLAIVIPYFKLTFFDATLQSLAMQTNKRFNLYIGNDASPENPEMLLAKFEGKLNYTYHCFEKNLGSISLPKQWERCIALSQNEPWIMVLGDDDEVGLNCVQTFYENLDAILNLKCEVVRFASRFIDDKGLPLQKFNDYIHPITEKAEDSFFRNFKGMSRSSLSEHIFTRKAFEKFSFTEFPLAWHSDDKAWLDYCGICPIYTINQGFVKIRVTDLSITGMVDNMILKQKARFLFFKTILFSNAYKFSDKQKAELLLEYGTLLKQQNQVDLQNILVVFFQFLKIGDFYNGLRFLRRMFRKK